MAAVIVGEAVPQRVRHGLAFDPQDRGQHTALAALQLLAAEVDPRSQAPRLQGLQENFSLPLAAHARAPDQVQFRAQIVLNEGGTARIENPLGPGLDIRLEAAGTHASRHGFLTLEEHPCARLPVRRTLDPHQRRQHPRALDFLDRFEDSL